MTARRILFCIHLCAGTAAGVVIFTMSFTGIVLAFERQIVRWADREYRVESEPGQHRMAIDSLIANVQAAQGGGISAITVRSDPADAVEFSLGRERTIFVNPYTGQILGEGSRGIRNIFAQVENVHRWFGMGKENRRLGHAITGACTLVFLLLVLSGPILWWPKEWTGPNLKKILLFRTGSSLRAVFWNWHNVAGIWCAVPLFLIVFTGVIMAYPWANTALYRLTGNEPPAQPQASAAGQRPQEREVRNAATAVVLEPLFVRAEEQVSDWKSIVLRLPVSARKPVEFSIDSSAGGRPQQRSQLSLDSASGAVVRWEPFTSYNLGRRLRIWARFTHTGEAGGVLGQAIAALAAFGACVGVFTGLTLSLWRFLSGRRVLLRNMSARIVKATARVLPETRKCICAMPTRKVHRS